jgi:hypothetical protein
MSASIALNLALTAWISPCVIILYIQLIIDYHELSKFEFMNEAHVFHL